MKYLLLLVLLLLVGCSEIETNNLPSSVSTPQVVEKPSPALELPKEAVRAPTPTMIKPSTASISIPTSIASPSAIVSSPVYSRSSLSWVSITSSATSQEMYSGEADFTEISIQLEPNSSTTPGYYAIELFSKEKKFGVRQIKYTKHNTISKLSWKITGGETWLALKYGAKLRDVFSLDIIYTPFRSLEPIMVGIPLSQIESAIFGSINSVRAQEGLGTLIWNYKIQDRAKEISKIILSEGELSSITLELPYVVFVAQNGKFINESAQILSTKVMESLMRNNTNKAIIMRKDINSLGVSCFVESKELNFWVVILFAKYD